MEISDTIRSWNQWWVEKKVSSEMKGTDRYIKADLINSLKLKHIKDIIGIRRSGKTTLFYQIIDELIKKGTDPLKIFFINFDDIGLRTVNFEKIQKAIYQINPDVEYLFLDEVQEKKGWEIWVRKLYDLRKIKQIFVTGSSASVLSKDIGKVLTGRHITSVVFPFSFREYLGFSGWLNFDKNYILGKKEKLLYYQNKYIMNGGFPEAINKSENDIKRILTNIFDDIIARDIAMRHDISSDKMNLLSYYLFTNFTKEFSYRKIADSIGINIETVERYIGFLKESFLIFTLDVFSYKLKTQFKQNKKVYCIDTGLRNAVSFCFMENIGQLMENTVFIELKRRGKDIYYWKDSKQREVDFLIKEGLKAKQLIQVCYNVDNLETRKREIRSLIQASKELKCKNLLVITEDYEGETDEEWFGTKRKIKFVPLWKWLLE